MLDYYLLEELVAFAEYGTLAAAAEHLHVTQPTLTRGMKKLEENLGVKLFHRLPNKIILTETGQLAAQEAQNLLEAQERFKQRLKHFEESQQQTSIASIAPGPLILLKKQNLSSITIISELISEENWQEKLYNHDFSALFTRENINTDTITSQFIGFENLAISIDAMTIVHPQSTISFKELAGLSFIVLKDIGIWKHIIEDNIPNAKFIYQEHYEDLTEITKQAPFPFFTTNLTQHLDNRIATQSRKITYPISDKTAKIPFYLTYLKTHEQQISPFITDIKNFWDKVQD